MSVMTPTELVQNEIARFLTTDDSEVLCVSGEWGVGKTFTWQRMMDEAKDQRKIKLNRYAYVSLFGINSLDELKLTIFENSEFLLPQEVEGPAEKAKTIFGGALGWAQKSRKLAAELPYIGAAVKGAGPLFFSAVRKQIVCIDDLERRGAALRVNDVLGLVSFLKEQRHCKIILLLNDKELGEQGQKEFADHFEKVIDIALRFAPTPEDSVRIALSGTDLASQLVGQNCKSLGISNIRVIKKIERFVRVLEPMLAPYDKKVFYQAVHSLTLLGWSKYQPGSAPSLEYLRTKKAKDYFGLEKPENIPAQEAAWNALLDGYDFGWVDEFDLVLLSGLESGYFDPAKLTKEAAAIHDNVTRQQQDSSFEEAWRTYHDTFDDNTDEVITTLYDSFVKNIGTISPINLNGTVTLFKELGRETQARELLDFYVAQRNEPRQFWDLEEYPFEGNITDEEVIAAFNQKLQHFKVETDPVEALVGIAAGEGWDDEKLSYLASLTSDQYYQIFKAHRGRELRKLVSGALKFGSIVNSSESMKKVVQNAREALTRIGQESPINARRVRKYGVPLD